MHGLPLPRVTRPVDTVSRLLLRRECQIESASVVALISAKAALARARVPRAEAENPAIAQARFTGVYASGSGGASEAEITWMGCCSQGSLGRSMT